MTNKEVASLADAFERALGEIQTRVCVSAPDLRSASTKMTRDAVLPDLNEAPQPPSSIEAIAIAYSGGLDSSVLLHLAHAYALERGIALHAFHIHHGISPHADNWLAHCCRECERLAIAFDARRVQLIDSEERGVEEAARLGRYAALGELCRAHHVPLLLTGHHRDDQAETVLLQLLRGAGIPGLSGMDIFNTALDLLGDATLVMARPLLAVSRAELAGFAQERGIVYIEDESNVDAQYARNALRHHVVPQLERYFPGFQERLARTAQHAQAAQRLLHEVGSQDLLDCMNGDCIDIDRLVRLSRERIDNALRCWFASHGVRMPSTSWLAEMRRQLLEARADARICVAHPDCEVRRHRGRIFLVRQTENSRQRAERLTFRWNGEAYIRFASFGGTLYFEPATQGIDAEWLNGRELTLHWRSGGERLKLAQNRPVRSLKQHYQALAIPAWERERLPLVSVSDGLLFAAGIGMDCRHFDSAGGVRIRLHWQFD